MGLGKVIVQTRGSQTVDGDLVRLKRGMSRRHQTLGGSAVFLKGLACFYSKPFFLLKITSLYYNIKH